MIKMMDNQHSSEVDRLLTEYQHALQLANETLQPIRNQEHIDHDDIALLEATYDYQRFLTRNAQPLRECPRLFPQQVSNWYRLTAVAQDAARLSKNGLRRQSRPWLRRLHVPDRDPESPLLQRLDFLDEVFLVAANPVKEKTQIAVATSKNIQIFNSYTGALIKTLSVHFDLSCYFNWSPDGDRLVSVHPGEIKIWSYEGKYLNSINHNGRGIVSWSPDGDRLVTFSDDEIRIWSHEGKCLNILFSCKITYVIWLPDGEHLVSISAHEIRIWSDEGECLKSLTTKCVVDVIWSPESVYLEENRIWSLKGEFVNTFDSYWVSNVSWSPNGDHFVSIEGDKFIRFCSSEGECLNKVNLDEVREICWSPDGDYVVSVGWNDIIRIWSSAGVELSRYHPNYEVDYLSIFIDQLGQLRIVAGLENKQLLWIVFELTI